MKILSEENLQQMKDEHRLVSRALGVLQRRLGTYSREHQPSAISMAAANLSARRVELEVLMETLGEFLSE